MLFEWDEAKREANAVKHAIDFCDAAMIWDRPVIDPAASRTVENETRLTAIGVIGDNEIIVAVVYTQRDTVVRLISARRARRNERKTYQSRFRRGS